MRFPKILLRKKVGQVLVLVGLSTVLLCILTAHQEWEYHRRNHGRSLKDVEWELGIRHSDVNVDTSNDAGHSDLDGNAGKSLENDPDDYDDLSLQVVNEKPAGLNGILPPCPLYPSENLVGRLAGMKTCVTPEQLVKLYPYVEKGGRVRPKNCTAAEKVAIIIPFRNRYTHLYILLSNLIPLLQRQLIDGRFFVIEQAEPTNFNRASLFNIGFMEAMKFDNYDCFIFHDVDLIPLNDRNLYRCDQHPIHFAVAMDKYNYTLPYKKYFGGVVGFTTEQYRKINGNSNLYFGWGGEDDDLFERIMNKGYEIARPYIDVGRYDMVRHSQDRGNEDNCDRRNLLKSARARQDAEGLNTIKYKVNKILIQPHMTWIDAFISMQELLATAPESTRRDMELKHSEAHSNLCNFSRGAPIHE